jgi:tRNA A37 threonylcarbamoyladenosine modification protein TsaB
MKMLLVRYTPTLTSVFLSQDNIEKQEAFFTKELSSKEITKLLIPTIQALLQTHGIALDEVTRIAATVGPAPAFAHRSMLAAINGIQTARILEDKRISLFAIDDFLLSHEQYKQKHPASFIVSLYNAFSQELFYLYTTEKETKRGVWSEKALVAELQQLQTQNLIIIGLLSENQKNLLKDAGISYQNDLELSNHDFWQKASLIIETLESVPFLFAHYTKLHPVEK